MNWIIKPGFFEKAIRGAKQAGLDLGRVIGDWLVKQELAVHLECCDYYPTVPLVNASNPSSPTATDTAEVPVWGMFRTLSGGTTRIFMKNSESTVFLIAIND